MAGITDLPVSILQLILSLLKPCEATVASMVSKEWRTAWLTQPNLEFNFGHHMDPPYDFWNQKTKRPGPVKLYNRVMKFFSFRKLLKRTKNHTEKTKVQVLIDHIDGTMRRYYREKISIQFFKCHYPGFLREIPDGAVEVWIRIAVENGAKILDLCCHCNLPETVFGSENIVQLTLRRFNLGKQFMTQEIRCRRLKRLCLDNVEIDEDMFGKLISGCNLMEELTIRNCFGLKNLVVTQFQKPPCLKRLDIVLVRYGSYLVEVQSASLEFLNYSGSVAFDEHYRLILHPCRNLMHLSLSNVDVPATCFDDLENKFPRLEHLTARIHWSSPKIRISSSSLQELHLIFTSGCEEIWVRAPKIREFAYASRWIPQVNFTGDGTASSQLSCTITVSLFDHLDNLWFYKLKGLIANLSGQQHSKVSVYLESFRPSSVSFDVLHRGLMLPAASPQKIEVLGLESRGDEESLFSMLDGLFLWCCRPKTLKLLWEFLGDTNDQYSLLDHRLMNDQDHINGGAKYFWQKDLKGVKVQVLDGHGRPQIIQNYYHLDWQ